MANAKKISELTTAGPLQGPELVPVVQIGATLQTTVSAIAIFATSAVSSDVAAVSTRLDQVSARVSVNSAAITSINNTVSALEVRVSAVSAAAVSINAVVSALDTRVGLVSAATSVNAAAITSINAEVSLKAYRDGDYLTNVRYINFDTSVSTVPVTVGQVSWNTEDGTLEVGLYDGVTLKTGQNTYFYVKNDNAVTIPKGSLAMATGTLGASGKITAEKAVADGSISAEYFLGVAANNIPVGSFGYITSFGLVRGMDTTGAPYGQTWADGDLLYANASVTGGLTNIAPPFPGFSTPLAIVIRAATTNTGSIFVRMKSGEYLRQLHDVDLSAPVNNDVLLYDTSISAWVNSPALTNAQASISALNIQVAAVSALTSVNAASITSTNNVVSALEIRVSAASATGVANAAAITSVNNVVSALEVRVSANSATGVTNAAAITSINNVVSALEIRVSSVSAAVVSTNNVVSALEIRVSSVSAAVSALDVRVAAVSASVSVLNVQMVQVLASISAINSVLATIDTAAITSINNVVSALEVRVSAVSATGIANAAAITSINNVVSALEVRVSSVSAAVSAAFVSIGQRVLRAGDTMTGQLAIAVAANTIGVSVSGGLVVTSVVNFTGDSALLVHSGTTATRPTSPTPGQIRFNSGSNTFEGYVSAEWGAIGGGGGATGGGNDQIFFLNDQVVSVSYSIPAGKNAGTFGPITIASGVTVEVPTSSVWTVT